MSFISFTKESLVAGLVESYRLVLEKRVQISFNVFPQFCYTCTPPLIPIDQSLCMNRLYIHQGYFDLCLVEINLMVYINVVNVFASNSISFFIKKKSERDNEIEVEFLIRIKFKVFLRGFERSVIKVKCEKSKQTNQLDW